MTSKDLARAGDPVLEAQIERALEPYRAFLSPETLDVFRAFLADALTTHPVGSSLLARVRPRIAPLQSGDMPKHQLGLGAQHPVPAQDRKAGRGGKPGRGGS
jgi:hypothetical protein